MARAGECLFKKSARECEFCDTSQYYQLSGVCVCVCVCVRYQAQPGATGEGGGETGGRPGGRPGVFLS